MPTPVNKMRFKVRSKGATYWPRIGFVTLLNSRHANVPPGFNTRWASFNTSGIDVTFRMPKAMVYKSYEFDGNLSGGSSCALASWKDICDAMVSLCSIRTRLRDERE